MVLSKMFGAGARPLLRAALGGEWGLGGGIGAAGGRYESGLPGFRMLRSAFFLLSATCSTSDAPDSGAAVDAPEETGASEDTDSGGDTDTDTGTAYEACDGNLDLGASTAATTLAFAAAVDAETPIYAFVEGSNADWNLASSAGVGSPNGDGVTWNVPLPAGAWTVGMTHKTDASTWFPANVRGFGGSATLPTARAFNRAQFDSRMEIGGLARDPAAGVVAVHVLDEAGSAVTGATVTLGGSFETAFLWQKVTMTTEHGEMEMHLPVASPAAQTQGGALYFLDACAGMTPVSVEGPCGACTLGTAADAPTTVDLVVAPDALSVSWWTCATTCEYGRGTFGGERGDEGGAVEGRGPAPASPCSPGAWRCASARWAGHPVPVGSAFDAPVGGSAFPRSGAFGRRAPARRPLPATGAARHEGPSTRVNPPGREPYAPASAAFLRPSPRPLRLASSTAATAAPPAHPGRPAPAAQPHSGSGSPPSGYPVL